MRPSNRLIPVFAGAAVLLNFDAAIACSRRTPSATMKSDLRNLVSVQESFFQSHQRYSRSIAELDDFRASSNVGPIIIRLTSSGYTARATHTQVTGSCLVYIGTRPPTLQAPHDLREGEPWCTEMGNAPTTGSARIVDSAGILILALNPLTWLFFTRPVRRNWPPVGLLGLTAAYVLLPVTDLANCRSVSIAVVAAFVASALALFAVAVYNRLVLRPA